MAERVTIVVVYDPALVTDKFLAEHLLEVEGVKDVACYE